MDKKDIPTIKVDVDGIKTKILHVIGAEGSELGKELEAEIERQITTFDYSSKVSYEISLQIKTIISEYFKFGEGYQIVKDAIVIALNQMFDKKE